jgi:DNA polymerase-3 subunit epsilon
VSALRRLLRLAKPSPGWDEPVYWALDLETSGLSPRKDRILSVGMVPVRAGAIAWGERRYSLVHPGSPPGSRADLTREAIAVHHILPEELEKAPPAARVLDEVVDRLSAPETVLLAHHAPLDVAFLRRAVRRSGRSWPRPPVVDTRVLLARLDHRRRRLEPYPHPLPRTLTEAREALGLPAHEAHHALSDALATAELFLALRRRLDAKTLRQLL